MTSRTQQRATQTGRGAAESSTSQTQTEQTGQVNGGGQVGTLRLRPSVNSAETAGPSRSRRVVWTDETVDNEGLGRKSSKICCIYHKPKAFDESSGSESSSPAESEDESSESDASSGPDTAKPNIAKSLQQKRQHDQHQHKDGEVCSKHKAKASTRSRRGTTQTITTPQQHPATNERQGPKQPLNAYERGTR